MKKIVFSLFLFFALGTFIALSQPIPFHENPKYGADSTSRMKCANNLSTMSEFMKIKLMDFALASWQEVFTECPASSKNIYIYGIQIYRDRVSKETDPALKAVKLDSLMMIYDKRIEHFGQEGHVIGRKGLDLLRYDQSQVETVYSYLMRSMEINKVSTEEAVIVTLMQTCNALFKAGRIDGKELIDNYLATTDILAVRMKNAKYRKRAETALSNVEAIFAQSGAADCEALVSIFTPKYNATPDDLEFLKKIIDLLSNQRCEDSELFANASESLYQLEPSSKAAYNLAKLFFQREDWEKSVSYYEEAIGRGAEDEDLPKYNYELGLIKYSKYDNLQEAREHARAAIAQSPDWGAPYILIGNLYASSNRICGENDFEKTTVFWAAVDKFQKAKSVDPEVSDEATELIQKYSQYFPNVEDAFFYGHEEGHPYTVGCWINESTTVRTRR
jgi:tetratricopeptide (TPR) repeat protein